MLNQDPIKSKSQNLPKPPLLFHFPGLFFHYIVSHEEGATGHIHVTTPLLWPRPPVIDVALLRGFSCAQ
jgi:hypothetical protein